VAGAGFIRRYTADPGQAELLAIEGVVILDREPPGAVTGVGTGLVSLVAEFEDGPFLTPTEVLSSTDLGGTFGAFGYTYDGVVGNNPCARARRADGALAPEFWNGNGHISLVNKRFRRLTVTRVDTSVGSVQFTRRPSQLGNDRFEWDLEPGQTVVVDLGAGPVTATFDAGIAQKTSGAQTFPTTFVGGETMTIVVDENTQNQVGPITVTFLAGDQSQAQVISRINAALGYTAAVSLTSTTMRIDGRVRGTSGNVRVTAQSALVGTALAVNTTVANGTGDVANIDKVTFAEARTVIQADVPGVFVERRNDGMLRLSATPASTLTVTTATTADAFGFTEGVASTTALGTAGLIPAGTRVRNGSAVEWVTMQTIAVTAANAGPYTVKVRPALDDGTVAGTATATVTVLPFPIDLDAFSVTNALPLSAALSEAAIDAAYVAALETTRSANSVARETNIVVSARSSNIVRSQLRSNAVTASAEGLFGRIAVIRPPLGTTTRAQARSTTTQPGVGGYRSSSVVYAFPGAQTFIPEIARRGVSGGAGFTADGIVDVGFDIFAASLMSQINPEENPGQLTSLMPGVLGIERGNPDVQAMTQSDYRAFKAAGIAALRIDEGVAIIQSGVVNVDPVLLPNLKNIARTRFAYFLQDSLAQRMNAFAKKLATKARRAECFGECKAFLEGLKSPNNDANQRIDDYSLDAKSGNTPASLAAGLFRIKIKVRMLPSMDVIVLDTEVGESVNTTISEAA